MPQILRPVDQLLRFLQCHDLGKVGSADSNGLVAQTPYFDRNDGTVVVASPKLTLDERKALFSAFKGRPG